MMRIHPPERRRAGSLLDTYLRDISDDALLTAEEERTLALAAARGDGEAKARMIRANLRLVVRIARDYLGRGLAIEDLVGEGNLGLIRAVDEFDPSYGVRFSTYAAHWIKQAIRQALTNTAATIRLPAHMFGLLTKWRRAERSLSRTLGRPPEETEIADALGLTDSQREMVSRAFRAGRLCREGADDDRSWSSEEAPGRYEPPDARLLDAEDRRDLRLRLERLDDRERTVVRLRYGLDGGDPLTLREVGIQLGVTREWVRKTEMRALQKLENPDEETVARGPRLRRPGLRVRPATRTA